MFDLIFQRAMRMVKFDNTVYREIKDDPEATNQAGAIVLAVSLVAAIGSLFGPKGFLVFLFSFVFAVLGWLLWSWVTMFVGTRLFGGQADFWQMARVLGYARIPSILSVFALIPCVGWLLSLAGGILSLVLGVVAIRESMELTTEKAIVTVIIGWIALMVVMAIPTIIMGASLASTINY